ncbi:hypothetical protein BC793_12181 [Actinoplanes xinjiangensis]|uniref:Uncharacterized protein n=1 Tax=Actinoplanes xinjiangensis TaxID=512350 RepID=A0A316F577_9ACTN|nr:hypothetical protein BC793_12181 [Actinoplanes xinjiangensis]GIF42779.1 hypothetical protein Axi01nite_70900 [Actinoplanes xinjiangensis]
MCAVPDLVDQVEKAARLQWRALVLSYRGILRLTGQGMAFVVTRVLVPLLRIYHRWFLVPMFWLIRWTLRVLWWLCLAYYYVLIRPLAIVWRYTVVPVRTFIRRL